MTGHSGIFFANFQKQEENIMNFTEFSEKVKDRVETEMKEMNIRTSLEFFEKMNGQSYHSRNG